MSHRREESRAAGLLGFAGKIIVYAVIGFMLFEGVTKGYAFGHEIFCPTAVAAEPGTERNVTVGEGTTESQAAKILKDNGLIRNEAVFIIQAKLYEYTIHPGTYVLNTSMTSREMLEILNEVPDEDGEKKETGS
ncbi:endolytic transglycosylase MltG [Clostridium sp. AM58-1XD]|uniref:endolytic transglycosylase MltG n=1 Tax=Clostridium sp. AM58-1XD TaxID=2292307 RepID=UPI000E4DBD9A|nr:endolytic transglycosylase MltG [Clostridium sp. AM58-1XD]RGY97036.1 aminodeoxychorismate lyase [Clostridium sp. AM58-1XD]